MTRQCHVAACQLTPSAVLQNMRPVPNVRIEDMGHKMGCNGVDNGKLWFDGAQLCSVGVLRHWLAPLQHHNELYPWHACPLSMLCQCPGVRVPRGALLDRYSQVDKDGSFHSAIRKPRDRFLKVHSAARALHSMNMLPVAGVWYITLR